MCDKTKKNISAYMEKYKEKFIVECNKQRHEINYKEVFTPVVCMETIHSFIYLVTQKR